MPSIHMYKNPVNELMTRNGEEGYSGFLVSEDRWFVVRMCRFLRILEFKASGFKKEENEEVEATKRGATEDRILISRLFIDVMIMPLDREERLHMNFEAYIYSLESDSAENAPAINMIVAIIGMGIEELKGMGIRSYVNHYGGSSDRHVSGDGLKYPKLLKVLLPEIVLLNLIMMNVALTDSMLLAHHEISFLKDGLQKCERNSRKIEKRVNKYQGRYNSLLFESIDLENLEETMEGKIDETWKGWGESENEKEYLR